MAIAYGGGCVVSQQNADIANTLQLQQREVAMATTFWLPSAYNLVV